MVSSDDFKRILGNDIKIINFSELSNYSNIRQILPNSKDFAILFYQDDHSNGSKIGHWTVILRYGNTFQFFDPYGINNSKELSYISNDKRQMYGESYDYLTKLLNPTIHTYNTHDYQSWGSGISTCGRWAILKIYCFQNNIISNNEFYKLMKYKLKDGKFKTYDDLVVYYTG